PFVFVLILSSLSLNRDKVYLLIRRLDQQSWSTTNRHQSCPEDMVATVAVFAVDTYFCYSQSYIWNDRLCCDNTLFYCQACIPLEQEQDLSYNEETLFLRYSASLLSECLSEYL